MDRDGMLGYCGGRPGYHLNKRHWNTIELDGSVPDDELAELVDHSWELVVGKLPRRQRDALLAAGHGDPARPG